MRRGNISSQTPGCHSLKEALSIVVILAIFLLKPTIAMGESQKIPKDIFDWWIANAPTCAAPDGFVFPSKQKEGGCDDGDINLFAGLLCASGESIGCETVKRGQDNVSGKWFRSPRRAQTNNLGETNSFSPDMALGSQLYIAKDSAKQSLELWLRWLDDSRPCWIGSGSLCFKGFFLRFCTDDTEMGCTVRPGDAGILKATVQRLNATTPPAVRSFLYRTGSDVLDWVLLNSIVNEPGYSQHLVAVDIYLLRQLGYTDAKLETAAAILSQKQPKNPFFLYLAEGATQKVVDLTLSLCPSPSTGLPAMRNQWAWERADNEEAWKQSMLWDCAFMGRLIGIAQ